MINKILSEVLEKYKYQMMSEYVDDLISDEVYQELEKFRIKLGYEKTLYSLKPIVDYEHSAMGIKIIPENMTAELFINDLKLLEKMNNV